jgi:hypothetical protein
MHEVQCHNEKRQADSSSKVQEMQQQKPSPKEEGDEVAFLG